MNQLFLFTVFSSLAVLGLINDENRKQSLSRTKSEWIIDGIGLIIQGVIVPASPFLMLPILNQLFPHFKSILELSTFWQFFLSFVVVDYIYYWNHRFFHKKNLWVLHKLHHSSRSLDIYVTSRNSFLTSFLFIYIWIQTAALFFLRDSSFFMFGLALTFALDLWRHSGIALPKKPIFTFLKHIFIFPEQHILHHSLVGRNKNYGANFAVWDLLHKTYSSQVVPNKELEKPLQMTLLVQVFAPWKESK